VRRRCGLRRRFRTVVICPVSDASYLLSVNWRADGLLLGHAGTGIASGPRPSKGHPRNGRVGAGAA
jgi:hypothetical protein